MKFLELHRPATWIAALTALLLLSNNASATMINIGGFAHNGSLTIIFDGIELGGDPIKLEGLVPDAITSFSAAYNDDGLVGPRAWDLFDLGSLVYNTSTGVLETLSALSFVSFYELTVGNAVSDPASNYAEISGLDTGALLASSSEFPQVGVVPVPGTLLLLSLGLLLLRRRLF